MILLVDDEPSSLKMLSDALSGQGFSLAVAMSGERMLEQVQRRVPDLILLDVLMPGMDGFEVLQRLKANPATKDVPVLFMTSLHEATDRIHGLELGAADFLTKPVDRAELLARINIQLTLRDAIRSLVTKNQELELARAELAATAEELRREKDALDFELKERLRQSQRLDSLGRLAGGVAHDFNNLLSVILGTADFLGLGMDQDDPRREDIDAIIDAAERGSKLTRQLLAVGRQQHGTLQRADVHALLQETEPLLARVLGEDVELELQLEARHGCVVIDAS
ncbi:MAG TPA: response regulator, partial [Enhygromyxa sp.]|nr:response regulator [Enhygromyxa sp.]